VSRKNDVERPENVPADWCAPVCLRLFSVTHSFGLPYKRAPEKSNQPEDSRAAQEVQEQPGIQMKQFVLPCPWKMRRHPEIKDISRQHGEK
jgi:hypothetical protein